jgi:uncharacterized protein (TIGR03435 family)
MMLKSELMKTPFRIAVAAPLLLASALAQSATPEFEAASIRTNPPQAGFHFAADSASGGPGTADPGMFRCSKCTLATLISKAFDLRAYQLPGKASLPDTTFDITAKIPAGATPEDFRAMQQNLLKERFGLRYEFREKSLKGYHLVVAKNGPKLTESTGQPMPQPAAAAAGPVEEARLTATADRSRSAEPVVFAPTIKPLPTLPACFPTSSVCRLKTRPVSRVSTTSRSHGRTPTRAMAAMEVATLGERATATMEAARRPRRLRPARFRGIPALRRCSMRYSSNSV